MFYFIRKHTVIDKPAAADCFFYLHTLFCIWIDSYFYCPVYFPHLIPIYEWFQLSFMNNMFSFYYNTIQSPEQVFLLFIYKILLIIYEHLCSNLQFISLPEEVGEFLLYIMLNSKYSPINVSSESTLKTFGKVVGWTYKKADAVVIFLTTYAPAYSY